MRLKGFCGATYQSQSYTADQERCVNLYPEKMESQGASTPIALYPTPGMTVLHNTLTSNGRAHEFYDGREFCITGGVFFEIDSDSNVTFRGFVNVDSNPATISWNGDGGDQIFITSGGSGYVMDLTTNIITEITNLDGKASVGAMLDGYFLALDGDTGTLYSSELLDGLTWTVSTMFAQRNAAPDPWVGMVVMNGYIYLIGPDTGEVWYDAGNSPFPFAKHPSGLFQVGTCAPFSLKVAGQSVLWLASSKAGRGQVVRATGFSPENVATYPVQYAISQYGGTVSDAYADGYEEAGHTFYVLTFPTQNKASWVYDLEMQMWHERGTWNAADNPTDYAAWRPRCHAFAFGEHRWMDLHGGQVYRADLTTFQDETAAGVTIPTRRLRRAPAVMSELERIIFPEFVVDLEPAVGLVSGQGEDPQVMMRYSNDGGQTWGPERWRSAGKLGEYGKRVYWPMCGSGRRRVFEVVLSDPVGWKLTNAYIPGAQPMKPQYGTA